MFIIIVFWLGCDRPSGLFFFVPALLLSILTPLFFPSSSFSLSYFVLAVPMRECLGKNSCMSSTFPIAILNGTCFFQTVQLQVHDVYSERKNRNNLSTSKPEPLNNLQRPARVKIVRRNTFSACGGLVCDHSSGFVLCLDGAGVSTDHSSRRMDEPGEFWTGASRMNAPSTACVV